MTDHEFERRMVTAADNHAAGVRRDLVEISAEMRAADAALRRKRRAASLTERTGDSRNSSAGCGRVAAQLSAREAPVQRLAEAAAQRTAEPVPPDQRFRAREPR